MKMHTVRNKQGQVVGKIPMYWSETLKQWCTVPDDAVGPDSIVTNVKINGVDRPDMTLDQAIREASEQIWAEHPNNPKNKISK